jgi:hypothetical protein
MIREGKPIWSCENFECGDIKQIEKMLVGMLKDWRLVF